MDLLFDPSTMVKGAIILDQFTRMVPGGEGIVSKLQESPETLSDGELIKTSLSVFSKSLGVFTSRRVINAYLRWLEVQRKAPRQNINYNWLNTISHLTQALRVRGFSLEEINGEVSVWKEVNGPFINPNPADSESRPPPTSANLAFGWDRTLITTKVVPNNENTRDSTLDTMSRRHDTQLERKLDSALTKVPASYICNRCKERGHYVGDCPTNDDPEYDISAGFDYVCKFCKERGTHYFLFCPKNPDPNSIYRRRQDRAFQSIQSSPSRGDSVLKKTFSSPPEPPGPATPSRSKIVAPKISSLTDGFEFFTKGKRIGAREATTEAFAVENDVGNIGMGMSGVAMGGAKEKAAADDDHSTMYRSERLGSSDGDMVWERLKNDIQREHWRGPQKQSHTFTKQTAVERTATETNISATTKQSPHTDFLSNLFAKHPSQPNPKWRPRMTAIEMWDINDEKKCQEEEAEMLDMSERETSSEQDTPDNDRKENLVHRSGRNHQDSKDIDDEDYWRPSEQDREEVDFLVDTKGFEEHERDEQEEGSTRAEKVRAIKKKINSIDSLRSKLASWEDVESPEMEQMATEDLSQEELDEISRRVRAPTPPSPSGLTSSSSELSSPPRLSSSGSRRANGNSRTA